ncbi:MAG TPA: hypothetical protein VJ872_05660 [Nocardioides sp.]|nr:hypothetical protein [Nocardioides sp.]
MNNDLDTFDRALLTELRQVAAETAVAPKRRTGRRWAFASGGVAAAAAGIIGLSATLGSGAAYAVDDTSNGDTVITIHQLSDAAGLEKALADHGIDATVDYDGSALTSTPAGAKLQPAPGGQSSGGTRIGKGSATSGSIQVGGTATGQDGKSTSPCGDFTHMPFTTDMTKEAYTITIPADSVLRTSDAELEITTTGDLGEQFAGLEVSYSVDGQSCSFGNASASAGAH